MLISQGNGLLSGISNEVSIAKSETIWHDSNSSNNSSKITEPYIFITSFCEHKKHKTSSSRINKFSSPNISFSKSQNKAIRGRKIIQSASSSPNISLKTVKNISQTPTRLKLDNNFDLNANLSSISPPRSKSEVNLIENKSTSSITNEEAKEHNPLLNIQPIEMYDEKLSEKWFLKCVCGVKTGDGNLICCDKCGFWQHCICFNYNSHTAPEKYVCVFCSQKIIRCKCGNNLDYNFSIIQCSNCGYYVHKRCEGFNYGPLPTEGDFLCHFCGKTKCKYSLAHLPTKNLSTNSLSIADSIYYFDPARMNQINASIINLNSSPFKKLIYNKFSGKEINAKTFFETIYNKHRTLFFICHPLFTSTTSKKKRNRLLTSFLAAFEYLAFLFYGIMHEKCVELFDSLIFDDLYFKNDFIVDQIDSQKEETLELSENARLEVPNLLNSTNHIIKLSTIPKSPPLRQTKASGLMSMSDLHPDQFVLLVDGLIGDIEEFSYDPKVNSAYYQITGTRFVLDTTRVPNSPLHKMKRSIYGNCVLKLISVDESIKCGLFISKNHITINSTLNGHFSLDSENVSTSSSESNNFSGVKSGSILTLGIDFLPAVLDEKKITKYLTWHTSSELEDELKDLQMGITNENSQEREKHNEKDRDKDSDIYYYYNTKNKRGSESTKHSKGKKSNKNSTSTTSITTSTNSNSNSFSSSSYLQSNESNKKKRGRKMKRKNLPLISELSLFTLFENEDAGDILFNILDDDDNQMLDSENDDDNDKESAKNENDGPLRSRSWNELENENGNENNFDKIKPKSDSVDSMNKLLNGDNS